MTSTKPELSRKIAENTMKHGLDPVLSYANNHKCKQLTVTQETGETLKTSFAKHKGRNGSKNFTILNIDAYLFPINYDRNMIFRMGRKTQEINLNGIPDSDHLLLDEKNYIDISGKRKPIGLSFGFPGKYPDAYYFDNHFQLINTLNYFLDKTNCTPAQQIFLQERLDLIEQIGLEKYLTNQQETYNQFREYVLKKLKERFS